MTLILEIAAGIVLRAIGLCLLPVILTILFILLLVTIVIVIMIGYTYGIMHWHELSSGWHNFIIVTAIPIIYSLIQSTDKNSGEKSAKQNWIRDLDDDEFIDHEHIDRVLEARIDYKRKIG